MEGCTAFGKVYHKECFKCCVCKKRIDGKFFEKNGKPYCEKDWAVSIIIIQYRFHEFFFTNFIIILFIIFAESD